MFLIAYLSLKAKEKGDISKGFVVGSSGNHGIGMAFAASKVGVPCTVVVTNDAPEEKVAAIQRHNGQVAYCDGALVTARERMAEKVRTII